MRKALLLLLFLGAASALTAQTPEPTPVPAAPPPAESPGQAMLEADESAMSGRSYSYDPAGRRDPFRSLLSRPDNRNLGQRPPGVAGISIDDVVVQGIWRTRGGFIAQVRATDNKSYLLRSGDLLYDGEVTRVAQNEVTFRQNLNDPQSVKPFRDVTKQLNVTMRP